MKYIIDCMLRGIVSLAGGTDKPMHTTGVPMTFKDVWIGLAGWTALLVIFFVALIVFKKIDLKHAPWYALSIVLGILLILIIIYFSI